MIGFWNRKEVYKTYSIDECKNILSVLGNNGIKCIYRKTNRISSELSVQAKNNRGNSSKIISPVCMYYIYVHKNDYECAYTLLANMK